MPSRAPVQVQPLPALRDNYFWLLHDGVHAAIVDPGDAAPVRAALARQDLLLSSILLTHHHHDHIGGVSELVDAFDVPVYGPAGGEPIEAVTVPLAEGEQVQVPGLGLSLQVLNVPGHTRGHIAYLSTTRPPWLFCGDTLFAGGCGRLLGGTAEQLWHSLQRLASLPDETLVYCAHEYTLANLRFAQAVEPDNGAIAERLTREDEKRKREEPTIPSSIGLEKATNPFLRVDRPGIVRSLQAAGRLGGGSHDGCAVFAALREWKNVF